MQGGGSSSFTGVKLCAGRGAGLMLSVTPDTGAAPNSSAWMLKLQHLKINTVLILAANAQKKRAVFIFFIDSYMV